METKSNTGWILCFIPIRSRWIAQAACVILALLLRGAGIATPPLSIPAVYEAPIGARSYIYLPDNSRIELNSGARILVNYTPTSRSVVLLAGEALFDVAHGDVRPFQVHSALSVIEDIGTQFVVRKVGDATLVTVIEGRIKTYPAKHDASHNTLDIDETGNASLNSGTTEIELHKHEQIKLSEGSGATLARTVLSDEDMSRLLAWRESRMRFENTSLEDAVDEFNRYHVERLRIADEVLSRRLKVGGSYYNGLEDGFILSLEREFKLRAKTSIGSDGISTVTLYPANTKRPSGGSHK
jgi:transmembrane sensor